MPHARSSLLAVLTLFASACGAADPPVGPAEHATAARERIVGGVADAWRSYVVGIADNQGAFCSGTVISRRTVLTAGHCFTANAGPKGGILKILFGPDLVSSAVVSVDTVKAVRHPGYDDTTLSNDLCLVELAADAPSQAVPLLRETLTGGPEFIGPNFTFVGYGDDGMGNYDVRRVVTFPIANIGPANVGLDTGSGPIDKTMFFFAVPEKNTCNGDSGGPAFVVRSKVERVAGTTSSGDAACTVDGTDARTDAPAIAEFIQPTLDLFEGMDPCRADGVCDESCNVANQLVDPDCAEDHCGADGMCVLSCAAPADPDCLGIDHCGPEGVCDPTCAADPDCSPASGVGGAGGGGSSTATTGAASTGGVGGGGGAESTSTGTTSGARDTADAKSGCGCHMVDDGSSSGARSTWLLALSAIVLSRRRRAKR
jgi:MYXO-CTERM domain-containing protein